MSFFVMPYRVLFHDTMAYGTHHFLTNFKFQCEAREQLFFEQIVDFSREGRADHDAIIFLTQQAYSRNLAPVGVGEKVAILVSSEEPTLSSVRFCFRVIRHDGVPVSCGFQTMVCISRTTGSVVPAPASVMRGSNLMQEKLQSPSFAERVLAGSLKRVFDEASVAIGVAVANAPPEQSYPRFLNGDAAVAGAGAARPDLRLERGVVFAIPGQGSYAPWLLRELYEGGGETGALFARTDEITRDLLGHPFTPLITAAGDAEHDALVARVPDLVQVGIFLGAALVARFLLREGLAPDVLVGHSAGELAALAVAGVYELEAGVELICERVRALKSLGGDVGGMLAVFCDEGRVRSLLDVLRPSSLDVAVVNHDEQTIVSGNHGDLQRLDALTRHLGLSVTRIASPYPFHSRLLEPAIAKFAAALRGRTFKPPRIPVYSPIERDVFSERSDFPELLSSHFVRPFVFPDAVRSLRQSGARIFIECGAGRVLSQFVRKILGSDRDLEIHSPVVVGRPAVDGLRQLVGQLKGNGASAPKSTAAVASEVPADASSTAEGLPIAIVSMGCVLPGAPNPTAFWNNILERRSAIFDAGEQVPELSRAFKSDGDTNRLSIVPDKTYSLLGGFVRDFEADLSTLPYTAEEFAGLLKSQGFQAVATAQCLSRSAGGPPPPAETQVFIGATADGITEYDEALLVAGLRERVGQLEASEEQKAALQRLLESALGRSAGDIGRMVPYSTYVEVAERLIGRGVAVVTVDAACASSLYAIDLGVRALRRGACNVALAGGVFAPGPANSCLFSQFRGLSATGSRPFDAAADGVVFGEGAAFVMLKRLPDALEAGDHIHAVIRGTGLSNDGKSPSVAVPRQEGQVLCLRRAYDTTGIDPNSVQYVEAHATATPVGDAVEFSALSAAFGGRNPALPPIELGSVKAIIGHTGWVAGVASVIKTTQALGAKLIPPQANYREPSPNIDLAHSPFVISTAARSWPPNSGAQPRRVGVNGFGFGGSNAHLILETFEPDYHCSRWARAPRAAVSPSTSLAVVSFAALFPFQAGEGQGVPEHAPQPKLSFDRSALHLPKGIRILPDVADHMDASQFLAVMAVTTAMEGLVGRMVVKSQTAFWIREGFRVLQADTGVVLGVEGKTGRGMEANQRIYLDYVRERLRKSAGADGLRAADLAGLQEQLFESIGRIMPSNPYTLPGLMPNVTAGRVANVFNLGGPNMVLDTGGSSLFESISLAEKLLRSGECKLVLAGGVNGYAGIEAQLVGAALPANINHRPVAEAAFVVMLASHETAREHEFPVLAELVIAADLERTEAVSRLAVGADAAPAYLMGAQGAIELARAIEGAEQGRDPVLVCWPAHNGAPGRALTIGPAQKPARTMDRARPAREGEAAEPQENPSPIYYCTPRLTQIEAPVAARPFSLGSARLLILTSQAAWATGAQATAALHELRHRLVYAGTGPIAGITAIDLSSEASVEQALAPLELETYDAVVAMAELSQAPIFDAVLGDVEREGASLLELLFVVARRLYPRLQRGQTVLASLCLGAIRDGRLHPSTGLFGGFLKSLARELPQAVCRAVCTDATDLGVALAQLERECSTAPDPSRIEVVYRDDGRHAVQLSRLQRLNADEVPWLTAESVAVVTGGARGVTAALAEELLRRFGCSIVLLGRTGSTRVPAEVQAMSAEEFARYEARYYQEEMARQPGTKLPQLRQRYQEWGAAREVEETLARLRTLPGHVEYRSVDVTDATATDAVMRQVAAERGRLDLVVHGAGIQVSKALPKKRLEEFRRILSTKLAGLANLRRACRTHLPGRRVHYHLLTSAFSYMGNDGQPDYGAANEVMNRIADNLNAAGEDGGWTTLGWLGWAGVGMTRGSEYAALARARRLRPVTRGEGQAIFSHLLAGRPSAAINILMSDGEIAFYGTAVDGISSPSGASAPPPARTVGNGGHAAREEGELCWTLSEATHSYLRDHLVGGRPTVPGTFEAELAAQAARQLRPNCHVVAMEQTQLERFVRTPRGKPIVLRARARVVGTEAADTVVNVQLFSDFVHQSGRVLQKDILHFESQVRLTAVGRELAGHAIAATDAPRTPVADPYLLAEAPVRLGGVFRCLSHVVLTAGGQSARFRITEGDGLPLIADFLTPAVLLDAMFRFSMIHTTPAGGIPIYVPIRCARTLLVPGINDAALHEAGEDLLLFAAAPRIDGEMITNAWVQATDVRGRVLLMAEDLVARRVGEVPDVAARHIAPAELALPA